MCGKGEGSGKHGPVCDTVGYSHMGRTNGDCGGVVRSMWDGDPNGAREIGVGWGWHATACAPVRRRTGGGMRAAI